MREHDDRPHPLLLEHRDPAVHGVGDVREAEARRVALEEEPRRRGRGHADEADPHARRARSPCRAGASARPRGRSCWRRCTDTRRPHRWATRCSRDGRPRRASARPGPVRRPPRRMRTSSSPPSSNSWLPSVPTSKPSSLPASIVGSSWNQLEISGVAPIMSPAWTRMVRPGTVARSRWAFSHAAPPRPGRGASRCPCRSFTPSSRSLHEIPRVARLDGRR